MKCDLTNREGIYECASKVQEKIGNVTIVINNTGIVSGKQLVDCSDESIQRTFDILKAFLPSMLDNNHGHIVTIVSGAGLTGASGLVDYCSSKFAAVGLHEALTLKKTDIKTTVVCPSFIDTDIVLLPMLKPDDVCDQIIEAIRKDQHMLLIPKVLGFRLLLKIISSTAVQIEAQGVTGLYHSMDTFVGRH
ncbi:unnamed protein product [Rotaria sp. Silwood1]|nr:unnamed protein product [Rotaria sp. Silwood1]